jgi:hypothetical protein
MVRGWRPSVDAPSPTRSACAERAGENGFRPRRSLGSMRSR